MSTTAPADAREALDMIRAGLGYLAAADAAQLPAAVQAECLRELEQHDAMATAARAGFLAAFTAGQGPAGDGDYSAVSWLIHRTGITRGAAVGHTAWAKRAARHPRVIAALAAGEVPESAGRLICLWTDKLPPGVPGRGGRAAAGRVRRGAGPGGPGGVVRGDVRAGPRGPARPGPGPGVRGPGGEAGHHDRRGRGAARGPDRRVRRRGRRGAGRAVRPGRETRTTGPRGSGITTRWPRRCAGWPPAACSPSGPGSRSRRGRTSRWPTCCCSTATPRCRTSGRSGCGPGGPRAARTPPRPARPTGRGWTATPPRPSRATPRWPRS